MSRTRLEARNAKRLAYYEHRERCFEVLFHSCLYYCWSDPIITDAEFDTMMRKLESYEKRKKVSHPESPTQIPGSDNWYEYPVMVRAKVLQHKDKEKKCLLNLVYQ